MLNPAHPDYQNTPASPRRAQCAFLPAESAAPPVVTIVTPFFNAGAVFYETAQSVFRQSLQQWEWLIVNDGSTAPEALAMLEEYRQKDPRIRVVEHAGNRGLSAARNTGFREARAPFVFQLDADDLIEPTTLEKMAWQLTTQPHLAFTTGFTVGFGTKEYLWRRGFHDGRRFLQENLVTATNLVRKAVHQAIGGYDEAIRGGLEDWDFWLKAAAHGYWGTTIPEFLDWYRRRDTDRGHWNNLVEKDKFEQFRARLQQQYAGLKTKFPDQFPLQQQLSFSEAAELPFGNRLKKSNKRLLFLVPHFEVGGADKFNLNLIQQLQRRHGYEVTVVATRPASNAWLHEFEALTPDVFALNNFLLPNDFALFLRYLIASRQPDVVCLSNSQLAYQLLPYLKACFPELPFVDYLHMEEESWLSGGYPRYSILYQNLLTRTIVSSEHLKRWMSERGGTPDKIEVCYTNIDPDLWSRARFDGPRLARKWNLEADVPVILYAGRICAQKQPQVFAAAIRDLARKHSNFVALVAGDGPDLPKLKEFVQREGLRQVRFLGEVSNHSIAELLSLSDIFFLPSQWEGISLAFFEAMAMEVVPIGAEVGGQRELVTPECGCLVRRGAEEVPQYTQVLAKLLSHPPERLRLAKAARERICARFDLDAMGTQMSRVFERAAQAPTLENGLVPNRELANLHAAEVAAQVRLADYADRLHKENARRLSYVKASVEWQSGLRTGTALAALHQPAAALRSLEQALQAAVASRLPDIELSARVEVAQAMFPLDSRRAVQVLEAAVPLAGQSEDPKVCEALEQLLNKLSVVHSNHPNPAQSSPLVSIVIPCYKQAHFLPESVQSVISQTFKDWELIIVNDGSPDDTTTVANSLIAQYAGYRVRLLEQPNGGLPSARNAGIRAAQGRYLLPLDADDRLAPTFLEKLVPVLDTKPGVGFVYSHIQHFGALQTEFPLPDFDRNTLISKDNIVCVSSLFRKAVWEQVGGYNETMVEGYEDWDFWVGCVEHGWEGYCVHEPLFFYRKSGQSMLANANRNRERLIARIITNHPKLYNAATRQWAASRLAGEAARPAAPQATSPVPAPTAPSVAPSPERPALRITYLITSILGVTGGNQTLLRQAEEMRRRGHDVTIVTYTPKPEWFRFQTRVIQVPVGQPMAPSVPPSDVVVATYFTNAGELKAIPAPVKVYYAQGDQFVFADSTMADTPRNRELKALSRASYLLPGIRFVPNSRNLAQAVERLCGRQADAILPVCTDQTIFRPLRRSLPGSRFRLLIVGPDARGTEAEPLLFKGIQDIHDGLQLLARRYPHFTAVRMSGTGPEIFAKFPCEFYVAPDEETKTALFGTSHILIYASHYDSCPRPPQEAMAAGCAVVCTATPGALEYCRDGENALLVPIQSPEAIAGAVGRLIVDHSLREKLVQGGLATAHEFPREREWDEWEAMLCRFVREAAATKPVKPNPMTHQQAASPGKPAQAKPLPLPACALVGHLAKAQELLRQKKLSAAWDATRAALQARAFHPEAYLLLAEIALAAGDSASARRCAQYAHELVPSWKPARKFLKAKLAGHAKPAWLVLPESLPAPDAPRSALHAPRLSVCLITKNEEQFLAQCLTSVRGLADQIVVVDTGSTDRTVEIAKEHGAEVHHFAWCDDFSAARNAALEHATGDWVLVLDADEELPAASHEPLRRLLRDSAVMAWRLPIMDVSREDEGCAYVPRLFRNAPGLFYISRVHEEIFSSVELRRQDWGLDNRLGDAPLRHHGYRPEVIKDRNKIERNLRLLEKAIQELPGKPALLMNYGLELTRSGQAEAGLEQYRQAFALMSAQPAAQVVPETREMLLCQLCTQLLAQKRFAEIVRVLTSPLAKAGGLSASLHFMLGLAYMEQKQYAEAAAEMRHCLAKRDQPSLAPINKVIRTVGPRHCLALCLNHLDQAPEAAQAFREAIQEDPAFRAARLDYARFLAAHEQPVEALNLLFALTNEQPNDTAVWLFGGQIALSRPEFLEVALDWTAQAHAHAPSDPAILEQRAQALTLAGKCEAALVLWRQLPAAESPAVAGPLVLCETVRDENRFRPLPQFEALVSREFLAWYKRLLEFHQRPAIEAINQRAEVLEAVLPAAGRLIAAVAAEAATAAPVAGAATSVRELESAG